MRINPAIATLTGLMSRIRSLTREQPLALVGMLQPVQVVQIKAHFNGFSTLVNNNPIGLAATMSSS